MLDQHQGDMPPSCPLSFPVQDLNAHYRDPKAPNMRDVPRVWATRAAVFIPAIALTAGLAVTFADWLSIGGLWWLEWVLLFLVGLTFFWIALSLDTAVLGLLQRRRRRTRAEQRGAPLRVALVMPIYNEDTVEVFGNACAMMSSLTEARPRHAFELFILSDTQDPEIAQAERDAFAKLRSELPDAAAVWYRRREDNHERKTGNLAQWVRNWGGDYEAMLVLDADSLMSSGALIRLADEMAADPSAGLIQSSPRLVGSNTLFGRSQQFAAAVYGPLMSGGLAAWAGREGNYWGHNAILRMSAFAACAGLPRMPAMRGEGGLIMSHDFVEAGLLRRAGWGVRFLPSLKGSYETPPATIIDFALRDRRWCHGNLQHLRLLATRGFHPVTRFHLFHGAVSYLLSPAWFCLLVIWALLGNGPNSVITYFSEENPLYPIWPEMSMVSSLLILIFMYAMLLAPKMLGAMVTGLDRISVARMGGRGWFSVSFFVEVLLSVLYAPIMMIQQMLAVLRCAFGIKPKWAPQARKGGDYDFVTTFKFHILETLTGWLLMAGMYVGGVSFWLLPIAISLAFAVPLSMISGLDLSRWRVTHVIMATSEILSPPLIVAKARRQWDVFKADKQDAFPAE